MKNLIFILLVIFLANCTTYSDQEINSFDRIIQKHIAKNKLELTRTDSGLYFNITKQGTGRNIRYQDSVSISYTGKLLNGKLVDLQTTPVSFAVKDLIMGWKEALIMSKDGCEMTLITPPNLAYGNHELEQIPPNSILCFNLKVWSLK